jgi:hypothetical protein
MEIGAAAKSRIEEITSYPLLKFVGTPLSGDITSVNTWDAAVRECTLARDYERLASTMAGYHWLAFAMLMLRTLFS